MQKNWELPDKQVEASITNALKAWYSPGGGKEDLLADYLIVQAVQEAAGEPGPVKRQTTNKLLLGEIEALERQNGELGKVLRLRFIEKLTLLAVANTMAVSEQTVSRLQKKGIQELASLISGRENRERSRRAQEMEAGLPPATYTRLFGIEKLERQLSNLIEEAEGPAVIALVGLGGIGKTALTDHIVRQQIHQFKFQKVIWLRLEHQTLSGQSGQAELTLENILNLLAERIWPEQAGQISPQQRLVMLNQEFEKRPYLIVIDNLESERISDYILDQLQGFARPTKFLLTSRSQLAEQSAVYTIKMDELPLTAALEFVRYHAQERGILTVAGAADEAIAGIYDIAGGNPMALKLVVSLLDVLPLSEILENLTSTEAEPIHGMYRHIYRRSWNILSEDAKTLLQAMPLVSEKGATPDYLMTVSGLSKDRLWQSLHELHGRSLIESRGTLNERRYGIHRLTNAFLTTEIMQMPEWL